MNYTKARHELRDFLRDTNYTNYHEGFEGLGQLAQIAKIRVSIGANSGTPRLSSCKFVKFVSA